MLVFVSVVDILYIPYDYQFVFSALDELCFTPRLVFHTALDAMGHILRVHYKSTNVVSSNILLELTEQLLNNYFINNQTSR